MSIHLLLIPHKSHETVNSLNSTKFVSTQSTTIMQSLAFITCIVSQKIATLKLLSQMTDLYLVIFRKSQKYSHHLQKVSNVSQIFRTAPPAIIMLMTEFHTLSFKQLLFIFYQNFFSFFISLCKLPS